MSDTVEVTPVNFAVTRRLVRFHCVCVTGGAMYSLPVDIHPSRHTAPLIVSSWTPSAAILSSIKLRQQAFMTTLSLSPSVFHPRSLSAEPSY